MVGSRGFRCLGVICDSLRYASFALLLAALLLIPQVQSTGVSAMTDSKSSTIIERHKLELNQYYMNGNYKNYQWLKITFSNVKKHY